VTGQEIGNSGNAYIFPDRPDTTVTLGIELPPSHYPSAIVKLDLEVKNGVFNAQNTGLAILLNKFAVDAIPKSGTRDGATRRSQNESSVEVSPQPARTAIAVRFQASSHYTSVITLYDILGRKVHEVSGVATKTGINVVNLSLPDVRPGVYTIVVTGDGKRQTVKLTLIGR
jgi:hypothetical protein